MNNELLHFSIISEATFLKKTKSRKKFSNPLTLYPITTYLFFACPS